MAPSPREGDGHGGHPGRGPGSAPRGETTKAAQPSERAQVKEAPEPVPPLDTRDWAVCCSGGGIRSATFSLGGLQTLAEGGLLSRVKYIVGVSGGSYIAASRALVARGLAERAREGGEAHPAYARGTPEEQNLRNNTRYIAPDAKTMLVAFLSLLLGAIVTCLLVLAPLYAFGHAWGWLLHERGVLIWSGGQASASISTWTWWLFPAVAGGITLAVFLYWWGTLVSGGPGRGQHRASVVGWAATVTVALALLMLAVPPAIAWLDHSTGALGTVVQFFGFGRPGAKSLAALTGVVAAIATIAGSVQKQLSKLRQPGSPASSSPGLAGTIVAWVRAKLTPWLTSLVIIAVGAFAVLLWMGNGAKAGFTADQLWPVLAAVGVMVGTRGFADINRTSLHDFYRWRLADAYAVTRDAVEAGSAATREHLFARAAQTRLSELAGTPDEPQLVIATTANINADREVPPGRGGFCLAFDPGKVTLRADPSCGEPNVKAKTTDYEHLLGHTRFTLFDVVAISGAAFSPLMGAATRGAYRIVLTLTNLRLGVWMPHPEVVRRARVYLDTPPEQRRKDSRWTRWTFLLLLWYVSQHPLWHGRPWHRRDTEERRRAQEERETRQQDREDRLWAHVLDLREQSARCREERSGTLLRLRAAVCWRVMQPTLGMLWAEAFGHTSYRATWINVTDGGHYDNLGLVEALRRGAENIVVFDASGDRPNTWFTLGGAMALARTDAEVDISLDPTSMVRNNNGTGPAPGLRNGQVVRPWAHGTFTRPDAGLRQHGGAYPRLNGKGMADGPAGAPAPAAERVPPPVGNIWICKLGWWNQAPWDVCAYAAGHSTYPCDPTLQQMYDGAEFEAYHELGASAVVAAATGGQFPILLSRR